MRNQENVRIVQRLYQAFEQGDSAYLLRMLTPDVDWEMPLPLAAVPWGGRRGLKQMPQFFSAIEAAAEFQKFEIYEYISQRDKVVALGYEKVKSKATGRVYSTKFAHVITLRDGKVAAFQQYTDTASVMAAFYDPNSPQSKVQ